MVTSAIVIVLLAWFGWRLRYWYGEGRKLAQSGYMPPPSTKFARLFLKGFCKVFTFLTVGPVKVIDAGNGQFTGRGLVLPNHQLAPDFAVIGSSLPFSFRQIAKYKEIQNPVLSTAAAWIGVVGVQVENGKTQDNAGKAIVDAGAKILVSSKGSRMLLFPQGKLVWDNVLRTEEYRTGATRIMAQAASLIDGQPLYALPIAIHYLRDPRHKTWLHKLVNAVGIKGFRRYADYELVTNADGTKTKKPRVFQQYGAVVVIGKPISVYDLPADPRAAIEVVRTATDELLARAKSYE